MIAMNPLTFGSVKCLAQKVYNHGDGKGTKTYGSKTKKGDNNKKNGENKRKGKKTKESFKKQKTVAVHAATTQTTPTPAAPINHIDTARLYVGTQPKCDK